MEDLARLVGGDAHVERAVPLVSVEAVERSVLDDPTRHLATVDAGHGEIRREAEARADGLTTGGQLVPGVLVGGRVDAPCDMAGQGGGGEAVFEIDRTEAAHHRVEHDGAEAAYGCEGLGGARHVVE